MKFFKKDEKKALSTFGFTIKFVIIYFQDVRLSGLHNFASGSNLSPTNGNSVGNISSGNAASFTDLSLSHLTSWNQNPDLTQVANTTAPSITLSAAVQAAASTGMTHP